MSQAEPKRPIQSKPALDTITTRFFVLFSIVLLIPMASLILFTASLLQGQLDYDMMREVTLSQQHFKSGLQEQEGKLRAIADSLAGHNTPALGLCKQLKPSPDLACLTVDLNTQQVQTTLQPQPIPLSRLESLSKDFAPIRSQQFSGRLYVRLNNQLYLFITQLVPGKSSSLLLGAPIHDSFLQKIVKQTPTRVSSLWVLKEPLEEEGAALWFAKADQLVEGQHAVPASQVLKRLSQADISALQAPFTLKLGDHRYKISQQSILNEAEERIARVVHLMPLQTYEGVMQRYFEGFYFIGVASLFFSVLVAIIAGRTITQPLLKLVSQVNALSRTGDLSEKVTVHGVNEINQLGEAFNRMVTRLRQEQQMKDEFVATLTHDLKVPLLAEKQTLSYMAQETYGHLTDSQREIINVLKSSNESNLGLVNSILEIYRYESGQIALNFTDVNVAELMEAVVTECRPLAESKQIELLYEKPAFNATAYADAREIKRVMLNLLSNAITNTPRQGIIHCWLANEELLGEESLYKVTEHEHTSLRLPVLTQGRILVSIQDSGIGFTVEDLPMLFQRFAANRGRNPMSFGLGLYNCYQVVKAHNGGIWVETTEGTGSAVNFMLPANAETAGERRKHGDRRKS